MKNEKKTKTERNKGQESVRKKVKKPELPLKKHKNSKQNITERLSADQAGKWAEETIHETELKYRTLFKSMSQGFYVSQVLYDENGIPYDYMYLDVNSAFEQIAGLKREQIIGKTYNELVPPDPESGWPECFKRVATTGIPENYTFPSKIYNCYFEVYAFMSEEGKFCALVKDITESMQTKVVLLQSEEKFKFFFENSFVGNSLTQIDGSLNVNNALCKMLGYSKKEMSILKWQDITHPDDIEKTQDEIDSLISGTKLETRFEKRFIHKNGNIVWVDLMSSIQRDNNGKPLYFISTVIDITDRKRVVEEYKTILQTAMDGFTINDMQGRILDVNDAYCRLIGYTRDELLTMRISDVEAVERWEETTQRIKKIMEVGRDRFETRQKCKDGRIVDLEISANYIDVGGGRFFVFARDINERKRAEETLRESEKNYRELIDGMNETVWIIDFNGDLIDVNKTAVEVLGYSKEELLNVGLSGIDSSLKKEDIKALAKTMPSDRLQIFETSHTTKDGRTFPVEVYSSLVTYQGRKAILSIARNITERKRVEEELDKERNLVRALMDNIPDNIYFKDVDCHFILISKALAERFGLNERAQAVGKTDFDFFTKEHAQLAFEAEQTIIRTGQPIVSVEEKETWFDRPETWVSTTKMPLCDKEGNIVGTFGVSRDITKHKQMEEELRQMQKLEGLGTLAGGIAHDFNNILGIILAYITSTERFKDDSKKLDLAVNTIVKAVERGKTLVQQILTFARKTETAFGAVNVNDVVMEIVNMIYEMFPKTVTCSQNFDKSIPYINADRSQLYQVLMNLCVNARDAMPKGGVLSINTRMVSIASLRNQHPDATASSYVCIEVSDTGEGMTPETQKRIFEPFFTTKGVGKGTGLGLAVVFGIVQTHKGFIDVDSELGMGTTFRVYIPGTQVAKPISVIEKEETLEGMPGGTETLLIVEDEEMLLMSLQMVLVDKGYKVLSAQDGLKALVIYQERKRDIALVLTDFGLPNITGLEVCQHIKAINPSERIILATGFLDPEMKSEFLKAGIQHFLFKPYDLKKVLKEIRVVLDEK